MKKLLAIFAATLMIASLGACGASGSAGSSSAGSSSAPAGEPQDGGILNIALGGAPKNLDPKQRTNAYESNVIQQVSDTLIVYNNDQSEYSPSLAESWDISEDGLEYTFKLRQGVKFHPGEYQDGREFVAEDVKYSLERAKEAKNVTLVMLDRVEVLDDYTVKCILKEPNAIFMDALTGPTNVIVPKEEVEGWGDEFGAHLIGTGPFKLQEFKLDQEVSIVRNDAYWGPHPHLDGAVFKVVADKSQQYNGLVSGEVQLATAIAGESVPMIEKSDNLVLLNNPNTGINVIGFNNEKGLTADIRIRQALSEAVDTEALFAGMYRYGEATYTTQPMPPASWGYDPSMADLKHPYNPEHAKELLADAGYPDGFDITINVSGDQSTKLATILQQYWKENLNVNLEIITTDWAVYSQTVTQGNHDIYTVGINSTVDPHNFTGKRYGSAYMKTLPGGVRVNDPEMDALIAQSLAVADQAARKEIYKEMVQKAMDMYPAIYYANDNLLWGVSNNVHGLVQKTYYYLCNNDVNVWMS